MLMPIVWVFLASFKPDPEIMAGNLWPTYITLEHYRQILGRSDFLIALRNSLIVATSVAIITTPLAVPAAYSLVFGYLPHGTASVAPARAVVPLGDIADATLGVFLANLNTAYNGVLDARPALGSDVVVSGLGVIGQIVVRLLKRAGARTIVAVDGVAPRRDRARAGGATHVLDPRSDPVAETVRDLTGAFFFFFFFFFSGEFHHNRTRVISSQVGAVIDLGPHWSVPRRAEIAREYLDLLAPDLAGFVTRRLPLSEAKRGYNLLDQGDPDVMQVIIHYGL